MSPVVTCEKKHEHPAFVAENGVLYIERVGTCRVLATRKLVTVCGTCGRTWKEFAGMIWAGDPHMMKYRHHWNPVMA